GLVVGASPTSPAKRQSGATPKELGAGAASFSGIVAVRDRPQREHATAPRRPSRVRPRRRKVRKNQGDDLVDAPAIRPGHQERRRWVGIVTGVSDREYEHWASRPNVRASRFVC